MPHLEGGEGEGGRTFRKSVVLESKRHSARVVKMLKENALSRNC